mmetsp:Transcript_72905/g.194573  ORF Transcript_72905/g.194573 Transcript_72905/m.194573 type:complete len:245 (+) Transcript_72905:172-906(+)
MPFDDRSRRTRVGHVRRSSQMGSKSSIALWARLSSSRVWWPYSAWHTAPAPALPSRLQSMTSFSRGSRTSGVIIRCTPSMVQRPTSKNLKSITTSFNLGVELKTSAKWGTTEPGWGGRLSKTTFTQCTGWVLFSMLPKLWSWFTVSDVRCTTCRRATMAGAHSEASSGVQHGKLIGTRGGGRSSSQDQIGPSSCLRFGSARSIARTAQAHRGHSSWRASSPTTRGLHRDCLSITRFNEGNVRVL